MLGRRWYAMVIAGDVSASPSPAVKPPWWQRGRITLEEFLAHPELVLAKPALEFEDGRVTQKVSPKAQHSGLQYELTDLFNRPFRRKKIARAFPELRVTFGGQSYVPDVSVLLWDRIPHTPEGRLLNDVLVPPDVTAEIVSPGQGTNALVRRCLEYVAHGVRVALLVDPTDESVILFRPGQSPQALRGSDAIELEDVLPGFKLTVARLFRALRMG
jgi:Uma2 family endonuclease